MYYLISFFIKEYRKNTEIRANTVRVVLEETNEVLGVMPLEQALEKAVALNSDLVEVSPKASPPVCKIMDFGQFLYKQKKSEQKNKKKQKKTEIKGIRLSFRISSHDLEVKENQARKFLKAGNIIRVVMQFKGREISHVELGTEKLQQFRKSLEDISQVDLEPKVQGSQIVMTLIKK